MNKTLSSSISFLALLSACSTAVGNERVDIISLDSAYFSSDKTNNYSFSTISLETQFASNRLFEEINERYLQESNIFSRSGLLIAGSIFSSHMLMRNSYHEWGHFTRDRALGGQTSTIHLGKSNANNSNNKGTTNYFSFAFKELETLGFNSGAHVKYSNSNSWTANTKSGNAVNTIVFGAGLNNEVYLSELYDENFFLNKRPTVFSAAWQIKTRLSSAFYSVEPGDLTLIVQDYRSSGVSPNFSKSDIERANHISLLSGNTFTALSSVYNYVVNNKLTYEPLMIGNFLIPNQSNYFTSRGLSRKIQSGYELNDNVSFVFGYEFIEKGDKFDEINFGVYRSSGDWRVLAKLTVGDGKYTNAELQLSKQLNSKLRLTAYGASWDSRSLLGERQSTKLKDNRTSQAGVRLSYLY